MGSALLTRWLDQADFTFTVVSPSGRPTPGDVRQVCAPEELAGAQFDLIVLAVKPQVIPTVLPQYASLLAEEGCLISMAAGFAAASLEAIVGDRALVRIMPNMPVQIGKGVSALYANRCCSAQQQQSVAKLMATTGQLIWVDSEDDIDRLTAIAGSGPGYVFEIARCWMQAGQTLGFSEHEAREMVLRTLAGSVELALASETPLSELRDGVISKNGTTEAGLSALNRDSGLDLLLQQTVDAAYARAVELR